MFYCLSFRKSIFYNKKIAQTIYFLHFVFSHEIGIVTGFFLVIPEVSRNDKFEYIFKGNEYRIRDMMCYCFLKPITKKYVNDVVEAHIHEEYMEYDLKG